MRASAELLKTLWNIRKLQEKERYQTVYSRVEGSSAAPTAGLHFTKDLLKESDVKIVTVVNFPLANNTIEMTQYQTELALKLGADEIDTVLNISAIKNKDFRDVVNH